MRYIDYRDYKRDDVNTMHLHIRNPLGTHTNIPKMRLTLPARHYAGLSSDPLNLNLMRYGSICMPPQQVMTKCGD